MHEIRKKLLPVIFSKLDTWPDMRLAYLMGTNSFNSVLAIAHEPREPPRITQIKQREGRRKWPCLGQLVSFFLFSGFFNFYKHINIYVNGNHIWMTTFLRFWNFFVRFAMSVTIFFFMPLFYVNVDWFKTVCVSLTPNVDLTYVKNMKKNINVEI